MNFISNKILIPAVAVTALTVGALVGGSSGEPAPKAETKTVTETVDSTPQSCIDALDAAEALVQGPVVEQSSDTIILVNLIPKAFDAGVHMDEAAANSIITTMGEVNKRTESRNATIESLVGDYNAASDDCRSSAGTNS